MINGDQKSVNCLEEVELILHDLKSPLTGIIGYSELLRRRLAEKGLDCEAEMVEFIQHSATRVNAMLAHFAELTRLEMNANEKHRVWLDVLGMANRIAKQQNFGRQKPRIRVEWQETIPAIYVNEDSLERAITNITANAVRYAKRGSIVRMTLSRVGSCLVISVSDRGPGISGQDLDHIFEKYYRLEKGGVVLGLYIARLLVEAEGGRIWAESELGKGTVFHIGLPIRE